MDNLKAIVYNKTEVHLKFKSYNKNGITEADLKEIEVGPGETKTILFLNFLKEEKQEIRVLSGDDEQLLKVLSRDDFPNKKKELLVLEMVDGRFQYAFVHWVWSKLPHPKLAVLMQDQRLSEHEANYTQRLKTIVDNRTKLLLTFKGHYETPEGVVLKDFWGSKVFDVPPRGRKTIRSGAFLKEHWSRNSYTQEIHVRSGEHVVLILSSDDFQNNRGKELILDIQHDRFGYAFLPIKPTSWKNWLCFSKIQKSQDISIFA